MYVRVCVCVCVRERERERQREREKVKREFVTGHIQLHVHTQLTNVYMNKLPITYCVMICRK